MAFRYRNGDFTAETASRSSARPARSRATISIWELDMAPTGEWTCELTCR